MAYLGDIALDEEDMLMFKVDRIVDAVQKTVINLNHTDTGKSRAWQYYVFKQCLELCEDKHLKLERLH